MSPRTAPWTIRVAIVEDHRHIREGLAALIGGTAGLACAGVYRSMEEALAAAGAAHPDIALVDIGLPGMSGIEGMMRLKERHPHLIVLMLTIYEDDDRIFEALCAGATGYLLKKTPPARLLEALREAMDGGSPMSPEVARRVVELFRRFRPSESIGCGLTPHETRVLRLLVEGHSYKTAAQHLQISPNTVAFHIKSIYVKLQVHSKSEAVAKALRSGLLS